MHELALAASLVDLTVEHAKKNTMTNVVRVHLALGAFAVVDEQALRFGFEVARSGTVAQASELCIARVPARASCRACVGGGPFEVAQRGDPCPTCGGTSWTLVEGDDLRLTAIEGS